jgi:hypothetical protein
MFKITTEFIVKDLHDTPYGAKEFVIRDLNGFTIIFAERE